MLGMKKIKKPSLFAVLFVLVAFTVPMTLSAGPPTKCPCFSEGKVNRLIDHSTSWLCQDEWTVTVDNDDKGSSDEFTAVYNPDDSWYNSCEYEYYRSGGQTRSGYLSVGYLDLTPEEAAVCNNILYDICNS